MKEKPKNVLTDEGIAIVTEVYHSWVARDKLSRIVTLEEVREADYNLSPSQYVEINGLVQHRHLSEIISDLSIARAEREQADARLNDVLVKLGLDGTTKQ